MHFRRGKELLGVSISAWHRFIIAFSSFLLGLFFLLLCDSEFDWRRKHIYSFIYSSNIGYVIIHCGISEVPLESDSDDR